MQPDLHSKKCAFYDPIIYVNRNSATKFMYQAQCCEKEIIPDFYFGGRKEKYA